MSYPSGGSPTVRDKLLGMVIRAKLDPDGYGATLKADPVGALQQAGLSADAARAVIERAQAQLAEPGAELAAGCADTTCILSICPDTCFITIPGGCPLFSIFPV